MPRTKGGIVTRRQHKKIIKMAKGRAVAPQDVQAGQ